MSVERDSELLYDRSGRKAKQRCRVVLSRTERCGQRNKGQDCILARSADYGVTEYRKQNFTLLDNVRSAGEEEADTDPNIAIIGMITTQKYSLWLMPHGDLYELLRDLIESLAQRFDAPVFEPHVTLLGGIRSDNEQVLVSNCAAIAGKTSPIVMNLTQTDMTSEYYRSLFVRIREQGELTELYRSAVEHLEGRTEFTPHISLLYADLGRDEKADLIREIGKYWNETMTVRQMKLYDTTGQVRQWREIATFDLAD
jgi:2'-5' RNA ligase